MKQISLITIFVVYLILSECSTNIHTETLKNNFTKTDKTVTKIKTEPEKNLIKKEIPILYFYKHFSGKINEYEIVMSLNRNINDLYGYYFYKNQNEELSLSGTIDSNNNIILNEYNQKNIHTGTFTGVLKNDTLFEGTWINHKKTKEIKFYVQENYSNSVKFEVLNNKTVYHLYQIDSLPYYTIENKFLFPVNNTNNNVIENFTKKYLEFYFGKNIIENTVTKTLHTSIDTLIKMYKNFNEISDFDNNFYFEYNWQFMWSYTSDIDIVYNENDLLSISQYYTEYTGGAHGFSAFTYFNYDLKNEKQILITDIIQKDKKDELKTIIKETIIENEINDHRYEMLIIDDVYVTENFCINSNGIRFVYNPYEIAPYYVGIIDVFVKFSKIKHILKK